jgi:hypothetical protein
MSLTPINTFDLDKIRYGAPIIGSVPDSKPPIQTIRVPITYQYSDGTYGPLLLQTERLFSFGLQENVSQETSKVTGYSFSLNMHNRDCPTQREIEWVTMFNSIIEHAKDHLVEHKNDIQKYELERSDLKKLNPLYYKKEKGVIVAGRGPTLYAKCIKTKDDRILTIFYDSQTGQDIDTADLMGKYNYATSVIRFESIFIGTQISYQVKLHESSVELLQKGINRVLPQHDQTVHVYSSNPPPASSSTTVASKSSKAEATSESEGSLDGNSSEEEETVKPLTKKPPPPTRVVTKVAKKK